MKFLACLVLLAGQAWAETVVLKNGAVIKGPVLRQDESSISVAAPSGAVEVSRSEIASVRADVYEVKLKGGAALRGEIADIDAVSLRLKTEAGTVELRRGDIVSLNLVSAAKTPAAQSGEPEVSTVPFVTPPAEEPTPVPPPQPAAAAAAKPAERRHAAGQAKLEVSLDYVAAADETKAGFYGEAADWFFLKGPAAFGLAVGCLKVDSKEASLPDGTLTAVPLLAKVRLEAARGKWSGGVFAGGGYYLLGFTLSDAYQAELPVGDEANVSLKNGYGGFGGLKLCRKFGNNAEVSLNLARHYLRAEAVKKVYSGGTLVSQSSKKSGFSFTAAGLSASFDF